jgi:hypothetical protein
VTELERKNLLETDRHIAECKNYIAKQREHRKGDSTRSFHGSGGRNARGLKGKPSRA